MILYDFEYGRPDTLEEAIRLLGRNGEGARPIAGGTDLLPNMRVEIDTPSLLISLGAIQPAEPLRQDDGSIRIDALSRLADLERDEMLDREIPMFTDSVRAVGSNQVREMGTLGGNLCQQSRCIYYNQKHDFQFVSPCYKRGGDCCYPFPNNAADVCWAVHMSDIAPALIAIGAEVEILGAEERRRIQADALYTNDGMSPLTLGHAELVSAVIVPPPAPRSGWGYRKSTVRGGLEYAMSVMAVVLRLEEDSQTCADARIVIGAVREGPVRAAAAEKALIGAVLDPDKLAQAAREASREVRPRPHDGFSINYMIDNLRVYLKRVLAMAADRARSAAQ